MHCFPVTTGNQAYCLFISYTCKIENNELATWSRDRQS